MHVEGIYNISFIIIQCHGRSLKVELNINTSHLLSILVCHLNIASVVAL